jgi:diaminopimelate epimerase
MHALGKTDSDKIQLNVEGGKLEVSFVPKDGKYTDVFLKGPATFVFGGNVTI